jgi:hypothetical protein
LSRLARGRNKPASEQKSYYDDAPAGRQANFAICFYFCFAEIFGAVRRKSRASGEEVFAIANKNARGMNRRRRYGVGVW